MAITNEAQFKKELTRVNKLLDAFVLMDSANRGSLLGAIGNLTSRSAEINDPATRDGILTELDALKNSLVVHYNTADVRKTYENLVMREYALDSSDAFEIGRLAAAYNAAPVDEKFRRLEELFAKYSEVITKLRARGIIDDSYKTNVGDMTLRQENRFDKAIDGANEAFEQLTELQKDLADAHSEVDVRRVVKKIDGQLRTIDSTNRRLARLRKKVGHIEPHQRSVQAKASQIKAARNQAVADSLYDSELLNEKLDDLRQACDRERHAASSAELWRAKRDVRRAEKELYGRRLTKRRAAKIDEAVAKRNQIIREAQATEIDNKRQYRREFNKTMKKLKKIDKKIVGKRNVEDIYWKRNGLRKKSGYLVGGTSLTLPKQVVQLDETIRSARR